MNELISLTEHLNSELALKFLAVAAVILTAYAISCIGYFLLYLSFNHTKERQRFFILQKSIKYTLVVVTMLVVLKLFGVDPKVILGAAGVLTVAIGFAAQTSVSNLISGLFLIFEKPFVVGDFIEVGTIKGEVMSVDLLSMRIRTIDNRLVRVPNEVVMKSQVINYSFFPIRRHDFMFSVAYDEDLDRLKKLLLEMIETNPYCLDEPEPIFLIEKMGEYSLELKFGVWCEAKDMLELQSSFGEQLRLLFVKQKVMRPFRSIKLESTKTETGPSEIAVAAMTTLT